MKSIGGRQWATREDLIAHSGFSRATLANLWAARETNGHPAPLTVDGVVQWGVMHWDLAVWTDWFEQHRRQERAAPDVESRVDRTGDPDEELAPAAQARLLGVDPSRITQYDKKPPPGWPAGRVEELPTRVRRWRTRRQLWDFVDANPSFGTTGGRPAGPATAKKPDPRVQYAVAALAADPGKKAGELAAELAREHGQSITTWKSIVTEARKRLQ
ncbi:hypothetical protein OHS33_39370 (plasmid) [Streptomyces sp. NBC_00536]|uniref:hypothetical protein n=1 Tax=Streptomyces sp. NBC_00536 TaxID=2975769 RepID=UPI002E81181B|nr:hypothetical protein [Streptomyces sp. NBC_00536]WUC84516.1 hypothetical protein OHS33_39370 [Streptomyces sp. NBC_00536]